MDIAITDLSSAIGTWQYTLDGVTWSDITGVTATTALALNGAAKVRLIPIADINGVAEFGFKMWDITNGVTVGSFADASVYTASGAFSQNNGHLTVTDARYVNALKLWLNGITPLEYEAHKGYCRLGREFKGVGASVACQMQSVQSGFWQECRGAPPTQSDWLRPVSVPLSI